MNKLDKIKVVDFTMGRSDSDGVNTDLPFADNFAKTRTIQQANVVLGAYVNRNYKDNRKWLDELENKADRDELPTKTSDLTNDGADGENPFVTKDVDDLTNYTNNTDLSTLLNDKASKTSVDNVKSAIDYKSTKYIGDVIVEQIQSKNRFSSYLESGSINTTTGENQDSSSYVRSGKNSVSANTRYSISVTSSVQQIVAYFYNGNTFISASSSTDNTPTTEFSVVTPNNCNYMRVRFKSSDVTNKVQIEQGLTASEYYPYQELGTDNFKNEEIVVGSIRGKNLFNKNNVETGKYYNASSISSSENWCISQIPIKPNTNYYLSGNNYNNTTAHIVLLDSGKNIIQDLGGYKNVHSIATTSSSAYIGLSIANYSGDSDLDSIMVEEGEIGTPYFPYQDLTGMTNIVSLMNYADVVQGTEYTLNDDITNYKYLIVQLSTGNNQANSNKQFIPVQLIEGYNTSNRVAISLFQSTSVYVFGDFYFSASNKIYCNAYTHGSWTGRLRVWGIK